VGEIGDVLGGGAGGGGGGDMWLGGWPEKMPWSTPQALAEDLQDYQRRKEEMYQMGWDRLWKASRMIDPNDPAYRQECADLLKGRFANAKDLLKFFQDLAAGIGGGINFTLVPGIGKIADTYITYDKKDGQIVDTKIMFFGQWVEPSAHAVRAVGKAVGRKNLTPEQFQLLGVLHELGHATGAHAANHPPTESVNYDKEIFEKCLK
jgi:hypothetical protein